MRHELVGHGTVFRAIIGSNLVQEINYFLSKFNFGKILKERERGMGGIFYFEGLCYKNI